MKYLKACETGKNCFRTENEAWKAYLTMSRMTFQEFGSVYMCPYCHFWHITSKKDTRPYWVQREEVGFQRRKRASERKKRRQLKQKKRLHDKIQEQLRYVEKINREKMSWWNRLLRALHLQKK